MYRDPVCVPCMVIWASLHLFIFNFFLHLSVWWFLILTCLSFKKLFSIIISIEICTLIDNSSCKNKFNANASALGILILGHN